MSLANVDITPDLNNYFTFKSFNSAVSCSAVAAIPHEYNFSSQLHVGEAVNSPEKRSEIVSEH